MEEAVGGDVELQAHPSHSAQRASATMQRSPRSSWPALAKALNEWSPTSTVAARSIAARSSGLPSGQHQRARKGECASGPRPTRYTYERATAS